MYHGEQAGWPEAEVDRIAPHSWIRYHLADGSIDRAGSGALIGPDLIITACHVGMAVGYTIAMNYELDENGNLISPLDEYTVIEDLGGRGNCAGSGKIPGSTDVNIYRVDGSPGLKYGWNTLVTEPFFSGDLMAVVGHPGGTTKKFQPGTMTSGTLLHYDAGGLEGGDSGSPVLNGKGFQIGVMTGFGPGTACNGDGWTVPNIIDLNQPVPALARAALSTIVPAWTAVLAL